MNCVPVYSEVVDVHGKWHLPQNLRVVFAQTLPNFRTLQFKSLWFLLILYVLFGWHVGQESSDITWLLKLISMLPEDIMLVESKKHLPKIAQTCSNYLKLVEGSDCKELSTSCKTSIPAHKLAIFNSRLCTPSSYATRAHSSAASTSVFFRE